ncbi:hypothetical protein BC351_36795 [Paenibacillus ferrarius]|uniref:Uncharacterized protein n=1 Tax=Paenibacillus ferrarius TaxID=1469647 RepID=A0A1V4HBI5_9BACL|nr:hypothetical protein [Paenibacillus ferrarius]OPH49675.1 hypothetical protein BC351_36795 [Paenibacillus ferrarius]
MQGTSWEQINILLNSIKDGSCDLEDNRIVEMIGNWIPSYNCEAAANGFLEVVPEVILARQHLKRALLKIAIRPMFYMGISESKQVFTWINHFLNERNSLSEECVAWLRNDLVESKAVLITDILKEIQEEE